MAATTDPDNKTNTQVEKNGNPFWTFANFFALLIIMLSAITLLVLIYLASLYISAKKDGDKSFDNVKELISVLLPVIGTWVGTLLAFYFSKENYAAAARQAQAFAGISARNSNLSTLKVTDVMIKTKDGMLLMVDSENALKAMEIKMLIQKMEETNSERLPILETATKKFIILLYRTTLERFILNARDGAVLINGQKITDKSKDDFKVQDLYNSDYKLFKDILNIKYCFLPENATLDSVQKAMQDNTLCQDVFITQTGKSDEEVLGWITNLMVIEKSELFKKAGM